MTLFRQDSGSDRGRKREGRRTPTPRRQPPPTPPARPFRTLAFWVLVVLLSLVAYRMYQGNFMTAPRVEISYTRFIHEVDRGNIASLQILEKTVSGELRAETPLRIAGHDVRIKGFKTNILGNGSELPDRVWKTNPGIDIEVKSAGTNWLSLMFTMLPFLLLVPLWLLFWRNMQSGGSAALKFGKTKAKVLIETTPKVTFKDVAGCDEAKQELHEIIEFLKEPQKFQRLGGRIPKGALLLGPPGSGKTLLAKAVAGEAGVPFFSMSGSDFVEMFVGVGASVTGDTPVLVRRNGETKLLPIGELVDGYFDGGAEGFLVPVADVETLGFVEKESKFKGSPKTFLGSSAWSRVRGVLRHHVSEIYEIHYLGGVLRTTGDHSVFVRTRNGIHSVPASALKAGDVLVNLPFRVRGEYSATRGTPHSVRGHQFPEIPAANRLPVFEGDEASERRYEYAMAQRDHMSQAAIASAIGVSQATVGNWQAGKHAPRSLSTAYVDVSLPEQVEITPELLKLFGFYVAEGRENGCLEFTFGSHETDLHREVIESTRRIFGVIPKVTPTSDNSTKITFHSAPLGRFFARHCGTGSHEKRVPGILWDLPRAHFDAFLTGYALGDGYVTQEGKLSMVSVSHQLIRELTWLCAMHGIKAGVRKVVSPGGRILKNRPLPETVAWNLIIGKTSHNVVKDRTNQGKRPIVRSVIKKPYDGFVYDLCGCDNEAFFGGEKPVLLHNSRVRDLFEQAKRNAPCLTGDTMVTLLGGRQISIAEMYEKRMVGARVLAMKDEDLSIHDAAVIGITKKPTNEVFEITTSTSSIRATGNHLFPVKRGGLKWVRADELSTDDHIAAPESVLNDSEQSQYVEFVNGRETLVDERRVIADASAESWGGDARASATSILEPIESAVCWTRIQSIERTASSEFVYDLCLDRYHNFVANRLFTHNCIVFVDEIDAVGRHRGAGLGGGHDEREQTLNQLLVEMDGFESNEGVIMIAATNRPDVLDPALLRPGRFDRQIVVDWPDVRGREGIFRVHTRNIPLDDDVELQQLARGTPGLAGADIANMVNEAALLAARRNRKKVVMQDFEDAKDKVMLGMERRSLVMTDEERKSTAFHEAGHALVAWLTPGSEPVDKVTIIPRGRALGITSYLPREERHSRSKEDLERWLAGAMGGRAAEQLVFGHLTTGASSDLENSTALARRMVCELGMSDNLGPLTFGKKEEMVFLGREISSHKDYSESTAVLIDQEVRNIIERAYSKAESLLRDNMDKLTLLANTLLEREVLDGDEMDRVLRGETLPPIKPVDYEKPPETPLAEPAAAKAGEMPTVEPFSPPAPRPAGA